MKCGTVPPACRRCLQLLSVIHFLLKDQQGQERDRKYQTLLSMSTSILQAMVTHTHSHIQLSVLLFQQGVMMLCHIDRENSFCF